MSLSSIILKAWVLYSFICSFCCSLVFCICLFAFPFGRNVREFLFTLLPLSWKLWTPITSFLGSKYLGTRKRWIWNFTILLERLTLGSNFTYLLFPDRLQHNKILISRDCIFRLWLSIIFVRHILEEQYWV